MTLTIDANFQLKNRDRHLDKDKPLGDGWGHWVPEEPYMAHVSTNADEPEVIIHLFLCTLVAQPQ